MISKERLREIREIANKYIGISLYKIAEDNNIEVIIGDLTNIGNTSISGAITKNDDSYRLFINSQDSEKRQRFTFAHELGHFFLHKDKLDKQGIITDESKNEYLYRGEEEYSKLSEDIRLMEYEANEFAGNILMPKNKILEFKEKYSIKEMSEIFNVSESAITVRIYNLTVRDYD